MFHYLYYIEYTIHCLWQPCVCDTMNFIHTRVWQPYQYINMHSHIHSVSSSSGLRPNHMSNLNRNKPRLNQPTSDSSSSFICPVANWTWRHDTKISSRSQTDRDSPKSPDKSEEKGLGSIIKTLNVLPAFSSREKAH